MLLFSHGDMLMVLKIVNKKKIFLFYFHIFYLGLPITYHINVKYLKYKARKDVNIASFYCQTDALQMSDMFNLMSVSGLYQS